MNDVASRGSVLRASSAFRKGDLAGGRAKPGNRPSGWTPISSSRCCGMPPQPVVRPRRCGDDLRLRSERAGQALEKKVAPKLTFQTLTR